MKGVNMKTKRGAFLSILLISCLLLGSLSVKPPRKASAEATDIYQVNGKYSITNSQLITKCKLYTADKDFPKKTRVYKITAKTKIQIVDEDDYTKKTLKGKKRAQMIKKLNKKNQVIQFKERNGKLIFIWI